MGLLGVGGLINQEIKLILENEDDFGTPITFTTPDGSHTATINGLAIVIGTKVDQRTGSLVIGTSASITFVESSLTDQEYPTRVNNILDINKHRVQFTEENGNVLFYTITGQIPSASIGVIKCELSAYKPS